MSASKLSITSLVLPVMLVCAAELCTTTVQAEPNGSYSSFSLSYRSTTFSTPICIGTECHAGLAGPSMVYSYQFAPNFALGLSASYLQSTGSTSTLKSTGSSVFLQTIVDMGDQVDVGAVLAPVSSSLQACSTLTSICSVTGDSGIDVGVFGKVFLDEGRSSSIELSYDEIVYRQTARTSVIGLSLVTVLADHHRLALYADQIEDINGNNRSHNLGYGYSYLF